MYLKGFAMFHPMVLFFYFLLVFVILLSTLNPVLLGVFFVSGVMLFSLLHTFRKTLSELFFYLFVWLLVTLAIPLFHHNGMTILFFLNDNPMTLESMFLGMAIGFLIISFAFWCKNYSLYITSDKILYLLGTIQPQLAIWYTLLLRFIPQCKRNFRDIHSTQKTVGFYATSSLFERLFGFVKIIKVAFLLSVEQTFSQIDSMKARGYGLQKRTHFSIYKFYIWDCVCLVWLIVIGILFLLNFKELDFYYEPSLKALTLTKEMSLLYGILLSIGLLPAMIEIKELVKWKFLKSKM